MIAAGPDWLTGYINTAACVGAAIFGLSRWSRLNRGQHFVTAWLLLSAVSDLASYASAALWHNDQPVARFWFIVSLGCAVEALVYYHHNERHTWRLRGLVVGYAIVSIGLAATVEPLREYSVWSGPIQGCALLAAASATLVRRTVLSRRGLLADRGFVVALGFCALAIPAAFTTLTAEVWMNNHPARVTAYYAMNNVVALLVALLLVSSLRGEPGTVDLLI